ncbi:MAG: hypothetical protein KDA05_01620 [Phycisphaerales bacterium]|nr:hypothetical protein [Phycisphaerales bacterium]
MGRVSHRFATIPLAAGVLGAAGLGLLGSGCGGATSVDTSFARPFPSGLEQQRVLAIQVRREPTSITFTNTTASHVPAGTMWLNKRYSRPFSGLGVGQTVTMRLVEFVDEFGESFRPGGFWATRASQRLVLAQFEVDDGAGATTLIGTVVVNGEEDPDARRRQANPY